MNKKKHRTLIQLIRSAIKDYYKALNSKKNANFAANECLDTIQDILNMKWYPEMSHDEMCKNHIQMCHFCKDFKCSDNINPANNGILT